MPAGGICPQCRKNVSPMARFCAQCGLELVAEEVRAAWSFAKWLAAFVGIVLLFSMAAGAILFAFGAIHTSVKTSQTAEQAGQATANTEAQRQALLHAHDPWWDAAQPDGMKPFYYGKEYLVGPGEWTSIDVSPPASSGRYRYVVEFEGINRFRARPNGYAEREFVFPNRDNLQPYQMSGWCQALLVQPLDGAVHRVRVKYVRVPANQAPPGYWRPTNYSNHRFNLRKCFS